MKHPDQNKGDKIPRLDPEVKKMNGKSTQRLKSCIDLLEGVLDGREDCREKGSAGSVSRPDAE